MSRSPVRRSSASRADRESTKHLAKRTSTTTYWGDRTKEYGIAPLAPIARIHDSSAAWGATVDDAQIETWLGGQLDGTHSEWPAPDDNTVYALYFPPNVSITYASAGLPASCGTEAAPSWHGFHSNLTLTTGAHVTYAVISRCDSIPEDPAAVGVQYVSAVASHEIIEAVTDPLVETGPDGYSQTDQDHIAFSFASLAELGDMCALVSDAFYTPPDFPYLVQRIWSNQVAPTGHDPCLPEPAGKVYFNSAPVLTDSITLQGEKTKGVLIAAGESKTIAVDLFSEAPTSGPWTVQAYEMDSEAALTFELDRTTGVNGDTLNLTIKTAKNAAGGQIFALVSTLGKQQNIWVGAVGN